MAEKNYDQINRVVIDRETKSFERRRAQAEAAEEQLGAFIKKALKNPETMNNLAKQGVDVAKNRHTLNDYVKKGSSGEGYGIVDEEGLITGLEDRPWERD